MLGVSVLAFFVGALVALGPGRLTELARALPQGLRVQVSRGSSVFVASVAESAPAAEHVETVTLAAVSAQPLTPEPPAQLELVRRALPAPEEVRAELKRAGPSLLRCVPNPGRGLALELTLRGETGRVQELHVTTPRLRPGARECVNEVFVDFQVTPFRETDQHLKYRYAW
jgi:hypothetical protein